MRLEGHPGNAAPYTLASIVASAIDSGRCDAVHPARPASAVRHRWRLTATKITASRM
jgi:hypothetical protein